MNRETRKILRQLEEAFTENADPKKALRMAAYMKDNFPFFGLQKKDRQVVSRPMLKDLTRNHPHETADFCHALWQKDQREFQYFGMELLSKTTKTWNKPEYIEFIEYLIVHKSWWDTVDYLCVNCAGLLIRTYPEKVELYRDKWLFSDNLWLNRSAILYQLKYKRQTDEEFLYEVIRYNRDDKRFFIRKAIGWALREYSKTNLDFVLKTLKEISLSGLSEREALKYAKKKNWV
jgi:3-methyladenine DNA glycosylase AlkD